MKPALDLRSPEERTAHRTAPHPDLPACSRCGKPGAPFGDNRGHYHRECLPPGYFAARDAAHRRPREAA